MHVGGLTGLGVTGWRGSLSLPPRPGPGQPAGVCPPPSALRVRRACLCVRTKQMTLRVRAFCNCSACVPMCVSMQTSVLLRACAPVRACPQLTNVS